MNATRIISWGESAPDNLRAVESAVAALKAGGLIVMPTDTVYGVAADARNPEATALLFDAKRRDRGKPIPLLASGIAQVEAQSAKLGKTGRRLAARYWPGGLTLVLKTGNTWEGFRVPAHPAALAILGKFGNLLRATSANISGQPCAFTVSGILEALGPAVEIAVDAGPAASGKPSTVLKIDSEQLEIIREGAIPISEIRAFLATG